MISEDWDLGSPAGESGETPGVGSPAGRGTVRTDAPARRLAPLIWVMTTAYLLAGAGITYGALRTAPWGLLLLPIGAGCLVAGALAALMAFGLSLSDPPRRRATHVRARSPLGFVLTSWLGRWWPLEPWRFVLAVVAIGLAIPCGIAAASPVWNGADLAVLICLGIFAAAFLLRTGGRL